MKSPIRQGDELEHGGEVTGGSPWTNFMGRPLARKGDAALCAQHGPTIIDAGYEKFPDRDGKSVAMHQPVSRDNFRLSRDGTSVVLKSGNVTFHCPGAYTIKAASFTFVGPDNVPTMLPVLPQGDFQLDDLYSHTH